MTMTRIFRASKVQQRYMYPYYGGDSIATTSQTATAGRVYVLLFGVPNPGCSVDQIIFTTNATAAGNVTAGIYRIAAEDTPDDATLIVQSASTAVSGANAAQPISLTATYLAPGRYYMALEFSDGTNTFNRNASAPQGTGFAARFDQVYGTLPSTVPTTTADNAVPSCRVRVVQP